MKVKTIDNLSHLLNYSQSVLSSKSRSSKCLILTSLNLPRYPPLPVHVWLQKKTYFLPKWTGNNLDRGIELERDMLALSLHPQRLLSHSCTKCMIPSEKSRKFLLQLRQTQRTNSRCQAIIQTQRSKNKFKMIAYCLTPALDSIGSQIGIGKYGSTGVVKSTRLVAMATKYSYWLTEK